MKIEDRNEKYYTKEGLNVLEHRVQSWIDAYNKDIFPFEAQMLGFGKFKIDNKEECESRIKELCELIGGQVKKEIVEEKVGDDLVKTERLIY